MVIPNLILVLMEIEKINLKRFYFLNLTNNFDEVQISILYLQKNSNYLQ